MTTDPTRIQADEQTPPSDKTADFSTNTPDVSKSPQTQSDTRAETGSNATGAFDPLATRQESEDRSNATANFTSGPVGRRASAVLQTSLGGYEIMGELGRGGMGVVYKAHQRGLNRIVALKMVLAGGHASEEQLKRFLIEARAVAHLQHQNIVQVFDIGENEGLPFFSLEYVDGEPLSRKLAKQPQPPKEAAELLSIIAKAMQYAHDNNILHRDLKPANILLTSTGVPKIADFGLAKQIEDSDDEGATRTGTVIGTPSYMAPEQARGDTHVIGPATDQYALGAMLYEMLTGKPPFAAARQVDTIMQVVKNEPIPPRQLVEKIPADLETICLKALQKDISKRYANCSEFAEDLGRFLRDEPILARPVGKVERAIRWCRRNPIVASLSAAAVLLLLTVAIVQTRAAMILTQKNAELAIQTENAKKSAVAEKIQADLAKKNQAIAEENERKTLEQKKKTDEQALNLRDYLKEFLTSVNQMDDLEAPTLRPFKKQLLDLSLARSERVLEQLKDDESAQAVPLRMNINQQLAVSFRQREEGEKALKSIDELLQLAEKRVTLNKRSDASRQNLVIFLLDKASLKMEFDRDMKASLELYERANKIAAESVADPRDNGPPEFKGKNAISMSRYFLSNTFTSLGQMHYRMGNPVKAVEYFREASRIRKEALGGLEADPAFEKDNKQTQTALRQELGDNSRTALAVGSALFRSGKFDEAQPYLNTAVEVAKKGFDARPKSAKARLNYLGIGGLCAEFLAHSGKVDEAMVILESVAKLANEAVEFDPANGRVLRDASLAYYRLGQWGEETQRADAAEWLKKAVQIREELYKKEPGSIKRRLEYAILMGRAAKVDELEKIVLEMTASGNPDSELLVDLARSVAQASRHATEERKADFQSKAVALIRKAVNQQFHDYVYLEKEIDFKPLWELPEFKSITAEIRAAQAAIDTAAPAKVE